MRPPRSLTAILRLPPGRVYYGYGLVLITTATSRRWMFRHRSLRTGRYTEISIGPVPAWDYEAAHLEAMRMRGLLAKGQDPVMVKHEQRAAGTTFAEACEGWLEKHRSKWRGTRHIEVMIRKHGKPLADTPVKLITTPTIVGILSPLWKRHPEQARRVLSTWANVFDYAKAMGYRAGDNPAAWVGNLSHIFPDRPKIRNKHFESMKFKELPGFIRRLRLRQVKGQSAAALEFLILTAARTSEVLNMKWSEIDLVNRVWTLPSDRTKQGRSHRIPLSERCMGILAVQNEYRPGEVVFRTDEYVFPGRGRGPLGARALFILLRSMDVFVTVHGFRASFRNWGAYNRHDRDLLELSLGHQVADKTEGAYFTDDLFELRRVIMEEWSKYCG